PVKRGRAEVASCALSTWSLGLRIRKSSGTTPSDISASSDSKTTHPERRIAMVTATEEGISRDVVAHAMQESGIGNVLMDAIKQKATSSASRAQVSNAADNVTLRNIPTTDADKGTKDGELSSVEQPGVDQAQQVIQKTATVVISTTDQKAANSYVHDESDIMYGCGDTNSLKRVSEPVRTSAIYKN